MRWMMEEEAEAAEPAAASGTMLQSLVVCRRGGSSYLASSPTDSDSDSDSQRVSNTQHKRLRADDGRVVERGESRSCSCLVRSGTRWSNVCTVDCMYVDCMYATVHECAPCTHPPTRTHTHTHTHTPTHTQVKKKMEPVNILST
jgi:hypothetical protein